MVYKHLMPSAWRELYNITSSDKSELYEWDNSFPLTCRFSFRNLFSDAPGVSSTVLEPNIHHYEPTHEVFCFGVRCPVSSCKSSRVTPEHFVLFSNFAVFTYCRAREETRDILVKQCCKLAQLLALKRLRSIPLIRGWSTSYGSRSLQTYISHVRSSA